MFYQLIFIYTIKIQGEKHNKGNRKRDRTIHNKTERYIEIISVPPNTAVSSW